MTHMREDFIRASQFFPIRYKTQKFNNRTQVGLTYAEATISRMDDDLIYPKLPQSQMRPMTLNNRTDTLTNNRFNVLQDSGHDEKTYTTDQQYNFNRPQFVKSNTRHSYQNQSYNRPTTHQPKRDDIEYIHTDKPMKTITPKNEAIVDREHLKQLVNEKIAELKQKIQVSTNITPMAKKQFDELIISLFNEDGNANPATKARVSPILNKGVKAQTTSSNKNITLNQTNKRISHK